MSVWVEKDSDMVVRLGCGERCSQSDCLLGRGVEVVNLEVEMHHRALCAFDRWPYRCVVVGRLLEHDESRAVGNCEDRRSRFFVTYGPPNQLGVEARQASGIRSLDSGSPPHAVCTRAHALIVTRREPAGTDHPRASVLEREHLRCDQFHLFAVVFAREDRHEYEL